MRFDFSNLCILQKTLGYLSERYDEDENAFQEFYDAISEENLCPYSIGPVRIYNGADAVLEYIHWFYATTPSVNLDDCTDALYLHLKDKSSSSDGAQIDIPTIQYVLRVVDDLFSFSQKLHPISISIVDAEMDGCNAESIAQFGDGCCSGAIFLYRTWNDFDGKFTPATVLLHELGHQLHFHLTNELCRLPESFYDFLRQLGADYSRLSNADMLEVFADTFLLAVIHKTKEFGNPFPEIDENTHERCYSYIRHILSTI
ncbi:MAG TPA: hypothetical protein IAC17_03855 [Candidatus Faecousia faecipullorum]|nr:hypothetical protein [Candidatus Faecousia faecipullorum]